MAPGFQFDVTSNTNKRDLILIAGSVVIILAVVIGLIIFLTRSGQTGTAASATPSLTPSPTTVVASPLPSSPTTTPTVGPTPTLEPYAYTVQSGETLGYIIQLFGYRDFSIVPEILRLNSMASETSLYEGQVLLIPRQTPTPGPTSTPTVPGATSAPTIVVTAGPTPDYVGCSWDNRCVTPDGQHWVHIVQSGDTIAGIAYAYTSRLDAILQANGLTQNSPIYPGQQILVPILVTLTPTLTPTGGPNSTATPTPTLSPPSLLAPLNGATVPRSSTIVLQWAAVNPLGENQYYLVVIQEQATQEEFKTVTRSNSYRLPEDLLPGIGQSRDFSWQVMIVSGRDPSSPLLSGEGPVWEFTWGP